MLWALFMLSLLPPPPGDCVAFGPISPGSQCAAESAAFHWINPPADRSSPGSSVRSPYHPSLGDPALGSGIQVQGDQQFTLRAQGQHFVEIFLLNPEADRYPFRLEVNGSAVDERPLIAPGPARLRPKRGTRATSLLAVVEGPVTLRLSATAAYYTLSAVRWTPLEEFEKNVIPQYLEKARAATSQILTEASGANPTVRRAWMQQFYDRIEFSRDERLRKEALLGRTRAWFWLAAENHEPDDILQTRALFERGLLEIPEDRILRQMISASCRDQVSRAGSMPQGDFCLQVSPVPWPLEIPESPSEAPPWAIEQRKLMRRMDALTRWWVEKRQAPNGELGGGWGDDVEILRYWGPQALGFGSEIASRGILNIATGIWKSGTLKAGYYARVSDVEHSSEPTTDTVPLSIAILPDDSELRGRLAATAACSENWIRRQPDGYFRFRSSWFNCLEADLAPERAVDVHLNVRAMGPAMWHAYLSQDRRAIERISLWADAWIHAMRHTDHGKPAGIFPAVMRASDGSYLIGSDRWDKPDAEWDYFQWSGGSQAQVASLVLAAYQLTGNRGYLDAVGESFRLLAGCDRHQEICNQVSRSPEAFYRWRALSGDPRYDAAFGFRSQPAERQVLSDMAEWARSTAEKLSYNKEILTSEAVYTDRVYYPMPTEYLWRLFGGEAPRGDRFPAFAVTWPAADVEFSRAVLEAAPERVRFRLFGFSGTKVQISVRLWRLKPGSYEWKAGARSGRFTIARLPHVLPIELEPQTETEVLIQRR